MPRFLELSVQIRPNDSDAFDFCTSILNHRLDTVKAGQLSSINERFAAMEKVSKDSHLLRERFSSLMRHWIAFTYPGQRRPLNDESPVPPVDTEYYPITNEVTTCLKIKSGEIWESFVDTMVTLEDSDRYPSNRCYRRLSIFERLSHGEIISKDRSLPHITFKHRTDMKKNSEKPKDLYLYQSQSCWKSLLLNNEGPQIDEWAVVMDHFTKNYSRSKKVLNILQQ